MYQLIKSNPIKDINMSCNMSKPIRDYHESCTLIFDGMSPEPDIPRYSSDHCVLEIKNQIETAPSKGFSCNEKETRTPGWEKKRRRSSEKKLNE